MRSGTFQKQLSGELAFSAFIPKNLPVEIKFDSKLNDLLSKADLALGRLDGIAETLPEVDYFIFMYARKEATLSSQIEGTQATFSELLKAESNLSDLESNNDVDEIINYINSMNYGIKRLNEFPLSLPLIKEIHKELLVGVRGEHKNLGEFRKSQNWVGGSSINTATYIPPPVYDMMQSLNNLEKFMHEKSPLPVLIKTALIHSQFESIHPFLDGNGRVGRLLITFYLIHREVLKKPLLYLSEYFKKHKQLYYDNLNNIRYKDDIESWIKFFLEGVKETSDNAVKSIRSILELKKNDKEIISKNFVRQDNALKLFNHLFTSPYISVKTVEKVCRIKNPSAIKLVQKFVDIGILVEQTGKKRNKRFVFERYMKLF